ncbi:MAG TPA: flavin reductase family protein [Myxococcota bacterium]|nr:flavin reductase family protein [Myxococcota bacterium]
MAIGPDEFKHALARRAAGVSVVTTRAGDRVHGMTVSAFAEVSLAPPLVLVCADKSSNTLPLIEESRVFAVNLLARDQEALSTRFASKKDEWHRFEGLELDRGVTGAPLLRGVVANLDCRVVAAHEHGDHVVYVGLVEEARWFERPPLLHFRHRYGSFDGSPAES